jgi:outer membrane protein OmpA-like peptidoglycan-associated protein
LIGAALVGWCLAVAAFWYWRHRESMLESQIAAAERRTAALHSRLDETERTLSVSMERTNEIAKQAAEAEQRATQEGTRRSQAEEQVQLAQQESAAAQAKTHQAEQQLREVNLRRQQELDRMQQALNKIAVTRRTPSGMVMELSDDSFRFDFDSAVLPAKNREILSRIAGVLLASEGYRLFIYGHTDDVGTEEYNTGLSQRRADSVARYLQQAGLPEDIMTTEGFGKANPVAEGRTRDARQRNRRVEIGVVDSIINYEALADRKTEN